MSMEVPDRILAACAREVAELWNDAGVRRILDGEFGIRLEGEAGLWVSV